MTSTHFMTYDLTYTYSDLNRRLDLYCWLLPFDRDSRGRLEEKTWCREVHDYSAVRGRPEARFAAHAEAAAARPPSPALALRKNKRFIIRASTRQQPALQNVHWVLVNWPPKLPKRWPGPYVGLFG